MVGKQKAGFVLTPALIAHLESSVDLGDNKKPVPRLYIKSVYMELAKYVGASNVVWPQVKTIADNLDCSEDLVHRTIKALVKIGAITVENRTVGGMKSSNRYTLIHQKPMESDTAQNGLDTADNGVDTVHSGSRYRSQRHEEEPRELEPTELKTKSPIVPTPPADADASDSPKKKPTSRKKPAISIPDTFAVTDSLRAWGTDQRMTPADLQSQVERFRNNAIQNDRRCVNWDMAFKNWMLKARDDFHNLPSQKAGTAPILPVAPEPFPEDGGLAEYRAYQQRENR